MKILFVIILIIGVVLSILLVNLGIAVGIYFLLSWLGAPQWVAALVALAYFFITGWVANMNRE